MSEKHKRCYVCKKSILREDGSLDRNSCQGSNPCNGIRDFEIIDDIIFGQLQKGVGFKEKKVFECVVLFQKSSLLALDPIKAYDGDAVCWDLFSIEDTVIKNGETKFAHIGINIALPEGYYAQVLARSSQRIKGIDISQGIIDADYRGDISPIIFNHSGEDYIIHVGDKVGQLFVNTYPNKLGFKIVEDLPQTERGTKGFGSTGR